MPENDGFEISFTIHGVLHHSVELTVSNSGWSIDILPVKVLKSNKNFVRWYQERFSRKGSTVQKLTGAISRLSKRSGPEVLHLPQIIKQWKKAQKAQGNKHYDAVRYVHIKKQYSFKFFMVTSLLCLIVVFFRILSWSMNLGSRIWNYFFSFWFPTNFISLSNFGND